MEQRVGSVVGDSGTRHGPDAELLRLAHELRNPLQAILGWSRILRQCAGDPQQVQHGAAIVERNAMQIAGLLDALAAAVRPPTGGQPAAAPVRRPDAERRQALPEAAAPADREALEGAVGGLPPQRGAEARASARILVLDDERDLADLLGRLLRREGHTVQCVTTVTEAIAAAAEFTPDFLLVDWWLRDGHDGASAARAVLEIVPATRVIVMSGLPDDEVERRIGDVPVLEILHKPFELQPLCDRIQQLVTERA